MTTQGWITIGVLGGILVILMIGSAFAIGCTISFALSPLVSLIVRMKEMVKLNLLEFQHD
jgi:hypothetical protein